MIAGLVMAFTYAVVRGITYAEEARSPPSFAGVESVLRINGYALFAGGSWFIVARLVYLFEQLWSQLALPGAFTSPADGFAFVFTATGVLTVILYAVTLASAALRSESPPGQGTTSSNELPTDG